MTHTIDLRSGENAIALTGDRHDPLKQISQLTGATVVLRGQELLISGTDGAIEQCVRLVQALEPYWSKGQAITGVEILTARHALNTKRQDDLKALQDDVLVRTRKGQVIRAKTFHQHSLLKLL